jgi:hypothetical protein
MRSIITSYAFAIGNIKYKGVFFMRATNRLLKSFYLFALIYILSEAPCFASITIPKEIPEGWGPLLACFMSVAVVIIKSSNLIPLLKKIY